MVVMIKGCEIELSRILTIFSIIDFSRNKFRGEILKSIGRLNLLCGLNLSNNNLKGHIPTSLGNLKNLESLDLSSNKNLALWGFPLLEKCKEPQPLPPTLTLQQDENSDWASEFSWKVIVMGYGYGFVFEIVMGYLMFVTRRLEWLMKIVEGKQYKKQLEYIDQHSNLLRGPLPVPPITTILFSVSNNKLTGEIPPLICGLRSLGVLDLSNNSLSGLIPQCLGNFSNSLSVLNLGNNRFRGTFTMTFTKGNVLRYLNLNGNQIEGQVSRSLLNCKDLEVLDLGKNKINDTFPHWLGTLRNLQVLALRFNRFHGHIGTFKTKCKYPFPKLRIINIFYNEFTELLPTNYIKQFEAMINADEHEMKLKYMGEYYSQDYIVVMMKGYEIEYSRILTVFSIIDFSRNKFQGDILKSIGKLSSLQGLNLSHNNLKGHIPTSLGNLKNLESLDLSSNMLVREIPQQLTSLMFLEVLNLSDNQLAGPIPQGSFSGQIPLSISNLAKLAHLFLSNNNLDGQIPYSIGNMSQLAFLDLSGNQLTTLLCMQLGFLELTDNKSQGQILGSVYEPANLTRLSLSSNNLSGLVELDKLLKLKYLSHLDLSHNGLSLSINNSVNSTMPKFYTIGLASCNLSKFPNFLRVQAELLSLDLSNNKIGSEVLKWVFDVGKNSLKDLDLSNNFLTGLEKLPWQTLQFIDLNSNLLHGPLPIPPITTVAFSISNNKLIGEIFPLICSLNSHKVLDLSNNNFGGIIPHCFRNFSKILSMLNLGMNSFHETFTTAFTIGLVLRFNRFHGHINAFKTKSKVPFTKLRIIDISCNEFSGLWPTNYIKKFEAIMNVDEHAMKLKYIGDIYYYDYVVVTMKGHEIEFSRILTIISIIDLSSNKFVGEILKSIGRLNSLQDLNLSHNNLKGYIPTSLGNLKNLESLDLSSNKLTSLMFLEVLNLLVNQLV
ncbi:hypothetical protein ACSBR2_022486 [Camellia fascicularis]